MVSATTGDGRPAVLKLAMPDGLEGNGEVDREIAAVRAGQGHGYVELLRVDLDRRVLLLERLGRAIVELDLTVDDRIDRIAETVARGWTGRSPPRSFAPAPTRPSSSPASSPTDGIDSESRAPSR